MHVVNISNFGVEEHRDRCTGRFMSEGGGGLSLLVQFP